MPIHYIQIIDNKRELSPLRKKCMRSLRDKIRFEDTYELIKVEYSPDINTLIRTVDEVKLNRAAEDPDLCFVDTDCFISKPLHELNIKPGKPYFAPYTYNENLSVPDIFYIYVNGRCDYFRDNLKSDRVLNSSGYSVKVDVLQRLKDFEYIPDETFLHTYETMSNVVNQQKMVDLAKEFESDRMELAMLRKSVEQMAMIMKTYEKLRKSCQNS